MIHALALSHARTQRGLSQRKLAQLVGLNFQIIRRLEAGGDDGNLTLRDFGRICRALEVAPVDLIHTPISPIQPAHPRPGDAVEELDVGQARLLRRVQRHHDPRRTLTTEERQLVLPTLLRAGLVRAGRNGSVRLSPSARQELELPDIASAE